MNTNRISIVVPVFNEERSVKKTLERIKSVMDASGHQYEIIAVNDGSTDKCREILASLDNVIALNHVSNKGYSASLKTGIRKSTGNIIVITDADGTYPVEDIPKLLRHMNRYDMVIGARVGKKVSIPLIRKPAKWFLGKVANYIAGQKIPDINSGLRAFRKELVLEFWKLLPERFSFTITMTMGAITNGYDVKFIPIDYFKREGKSTIHPLKDFLGFNKILLKIMLFFRPLKIFVPLSIITLLVGVLIFIAGLLFFGRFLDTTAVIIFLAAIQFFVLGLIAELIVRSK